MTDEGTHFYGDGCPEHPVDPNADTPKTGASPPRRSGKSSDLQRLSPTATPESNPSTPESAECDAVAFGRPCTLTWGHDWDHAYAPENAEVPMTNNDQPVTWHVPPMTGNPVADVRMSNTHGQPENNPSTPPTTSAEGPVDHV